MQDHGTKLSLLGGTPAFSEPVHVGRPNVKGRDAFMRRVGEIFDRKWLTNDGPMVREFERHVSSITGAKHCVAMCNATVALEIAIRALGLRGEVIIPSYTFVATAHALQWQEITPVFGDMDPRTHTLDPARIERLITPKTTGIIGVHLWGRACDTEAIEEIGRKRNLTVMYDAAHALACSHLGRPIGGFGSCEVFSFHATKFINSFEGGAVTTNDDALADRMKLMRNFGFSGYDNVIYPGTNGKMTEVCAAMGISSLELIDDVVAANKRNYTIYRETLGNIPGLSLLQYPTDEKANYQYVVLEVDPERAPLDRDQLVAVLHAENVLARKYFWPGCHNMEPYRSLQPNARLLLTDTERVAAKVVVLPTGLAMEEESVRTICRIIRAALSNADAVKAALLAAKPRS